MDSLIRDIADEKEGAKNFLVLADTMANFSIRGLEYDDSIFGDIDENDMPMIDKARAIMGPAYARGLARHIIERMHEPEMNKSIDAFKKLMRLE